MLGVITLIVLGVAIWAAVPSRQGEMLGSPGEIRELPLDSYDGVANIAVQSLDVRTGVMRATASVYLNHSSWYQTFQTSDLRKVRLEFSVMGGGTSRPVSSEVQLEQSMSLPTFEVPLAGGPPAAYPYDRYIAWIRLDLSVPEGVTLPTLVKAKRLERKLLLAVNYVTLDETLRDWVLVAQSNERQPFYISRGYAERIPSLIHSIQLVVERGDKTLAFIYSIFSIPALLVASYLVARRRSAGRRADADDSRTSPLELAAALLAVITLRQVLIPADITGFTTLDKLLGIQVAAIAAATILSHTVWPATAKSTLAASGRRDRNTAWPPAPSTTSDEASDVLSAEQTADGEIGHADRRR